MEQRQGGPRRVVVALSGGVDSAVACALLVEQGFEAIGLMMRLWAESGTDRSALNRCCSLEAIEDARAICRHLGIPFYVINYELPFLDRVVGPFVADYTSGRTPNPCLACNRYLKFGALLQRALALDAHYLATGHYARIRQSDGAFQLLRARDRDKDQSYALYMLGPYELRHALFPVGDLLKDEVREAARRLRLPVADKPESQEICFIPDNDYRRFLMARVPEAFRPGPIVDRAGRVLGQHQGLPCYTVGQRKGLGIAAPTPLYVLEIDVARNALVVGPQRELGQRALLAGDVSWVAGKPPEGPIGATVRIRLHGRETPATVIPLLEGQAQVVFARPQRDITPGQAAVFYDGDVVLGGGVIARALRDVRCGPEGT
ncbi:MAG: tRNA 2-thiouridine(34) synthase MnmA [Anaerolineae bacterium]|nr:tRNA 2-thiouridine(34) synthase MnmA [Anaerolineae bacterium]